MKSMKLIVAICGASGIEYGVNVLKALKDAGVETHLVLSEWAEELITEETNLKVEDVKRLADHCFEYRDMAAPISSSSYPVDGMVVVPATVKTVSEIANAHSGNLISRAADNMLKTRKKLVVCVRETPLSGPCLENLRKIAQYGGVVMPLCPGFYHKPKDLNDMYSFMTGKVLDALDIKNNVYKRWKE